MIRQGTGATESGMRAFLESKMRSRGLVFVKYWGVACHTRVLTPQSDVWPSFCWGPRRCCGCWSDACSELTTLLPAVELNLAKPVVVGRLGVIPADALEEDRGAQVEGHWVVTHCVDNFEFEASAAACHGFVSF